MKELVINEQNIQNKIFTVRGKQVMLDEHLAEIYGVETKYLNRSVKEILKDFLKASVSGLQKKSMKI